MKLRRFDDYTIDRRNSAIYIDFRGKEYGGNLSAGSNDRIEVFRAVGDPNTYYIYSENTGLPYVGLQVVERTRSGLDTIGEVFFQEWQVEDALGRRWEDRTALTNAKKLAQYSYNNNPRKRKNSRKRKNTSDLNFTKANLKKMITVAKKAKTGLVIYSTGGGVSDLVVSSFSSNFVRDLTYPTRFELMYQNAKNQVNNEKDFFRSSYKRSPMPTFHIRLDKQKNPRKRKNGKSPILYEVKNKAKWNKVKKQFPHSNMFSHKGDTYVVAIMPDVLLAPYGIQQVIAMNYDLIEKEERAARTVKKRKNPRPAPRSQNTKTKAVWSPVNQAWFVLFGDTPISIQGQMTFKNKEELKYILSQQGLKLKSNNVIVADGANPFSNPRKRRNSNQKHRLTLSARQIETLYDYHAGQGSLFYSIASRANRKGYVDLTLDELSDMSSELRYMINTYSKNKGDIRSFEAIERKVDKILDAQRKRR
jgi:hypothetical protein